MRQFVVPIVRTRHNLNVVSLFMKRPLGGLYYDYKLFEVSLNKTRYNVNILQLVQ